MQTQIRFALMDPGHIAHLRVLICDGPGVALHDIRIGDRVRVSWPDGLNQCIDVVSRDLPEDATAWKPILVPCEQSH